MTDVMPAESKVGYDLEAKYRDEEGIFYYTGVQALVRVPIDQMRIDRRNGLHTASFISGYQGSPLGGFDREIISQRALLEQLDIVHQPGLNEELGATAVMGSQVSAVFPKQKFDGVLGIWYGKSPGLDRSGDAIRHAAYAGTQEHGGVLALTGDDPANKSSTLPSSSEYSLADLHVLVLQPGNTQEVYDLGLHGVALSRAAGLWTGIKIVTAIADGTGNAHVGPDRITPVIPEVMFKGAPYRPRVTGNLAGARANAVEEEIYGPRTELALQYAVLNNLNRITVDPDDAWLGIVASGHCYHDTLEALHLLGLDEDALRHLGIRVLQLSMLHPFDTRTAGRFARGLRGDPRRRGEAGLHRDRPPRRALRHHRRTPGHRQEGPRRPAAHRRPRPARHRLPRRAAAGPAHHEDRPRQADPRHAPALAGLQAPHRDPPQPHPVLLLGMSALHRDEGARPTRSSAAASAATASSG